MTQHPSPPRMTRISHHPPSVARYPLSALFSLLSIASCLLLLLPMPARGGETTSTLERAIPAGELTPILDQLEKDLGSLETLQVAFHQEKRLAVFDDVVESDGVYLFHAPSSVRLETTSPYRSVLLVNRMVVTKYEQVDGKWQRLNLGSPEMMLMVVDQIADWMRGRLRQRADLYDVSARERGQLTVTLTPRHAEFRKVITSIDLTLASDRRRVTSVVIHQPSGDYTRLAFADPVVNHQLDAALFDTTAEAPQPVTGK